MDSRYSDLQNLTDAVELSRIVKEIAADEPGIIDDPDHQRAFALGVVCAALAASNAARLNTEGKS